MIDHSLSLEQAAFVLCGNAEPAALQWVSVRLRGKARPVFEGFKAQGKWRMTPEQLELNVARCQPERTVVSDVPAVSSMTRTSRRRLAG